MAPGVRSGRTGHPKADPGGWSPQRTGAGGEGRCLRTRWRAGAAGMLLANCLLCAGMLSLLVRCALAAEAEKSTYDASGSSSLPSDPAATAAPAHPLTDPSVAEEVPFSAFHSDGDSESEGEGLSGQAAFSSVLTVMAGTVKHSVSRDQSRTSPTITRDETHTTQWPSHGSSRSSEMSSSSSYVGDRILPATNSSGLTSTTSHQHTTPRQAVTMLSSVSRPSHVGNRKNPSFASSTISSPSLSPSVSSPSPSTSSVLSSLVSLFSLSQWIDATSQGQRIVSSPAPLKETAKFKPAGSLGWTGSLTNTQSTTADAHAVAGLPDVTWGLQSTKIKPPHFPSETRTEKSNKITKNPFNSSAETMSGAYIRSMSSIGIKTPATSMYTSDSSSNHGQNLLKFLYGSTQMRSSMNSASASNIEISTSFASNQESQAVQTQQGDSQYSTSTLPSAHPKEHSVSSHVTKQMLNRTARAEIDEKTAADSHTSVHESIGDSLKSPISSHVVNPTASAAMAFRPSGSFITITSKIPPGETSRSEITITEPTRIYFGMVSSERASDSSDLLMAMGHGSPRVPAININYNQGEIAGAQLKSISTQAHQNNSLSLTRTRPESTRMGTTSSTSESDSLNLPSNEVINLQQFVTRARSPNGITQGPGGLTTLKMIFSFNSRTVSLSPVLPVRSPKEMTHKTMHESFSHPIQPTYVSPLFLSHSLNHNHSNLPVVSASSDFADQPRASLSPKITPSQRPFQTRSLLTLPHKFYTKSGLTQYPNEYQQTASSDEVSAYVIESERAGYTVPLTFEVETSAGNEQTSPASFTTTKEVFELNKGSDGSGKGSPAEISSSPVTFNAPFGPLKSLSRKDDVTVTGRHEWSSPSSKSVIIPTRRTNHSSLALGPITSVSSDKSHFYLGRQTTIRSTAPSAAAAASSSDGPNSIETASAIFSFGTKLMAPHTKWKATKPVPFQSSAFNSESTSTGTDRAISNLPADDPSYEHPKPEDGQEHNVHMLNSIDPTVITSDLYSLYPTVGEPSSFTYVTGTSDFREQSMKLSQANLRSSEVVSVQQGATENSAAAPSVWGLGTFLPLSHITTDSGTHLANDMPVTLPINPAHSFSDTDRISNTSDLKLKGSTSPKVPTTSSSPLETSSLSLSCTKASQVSSLHMNLTTSVSSEASTSVSWSSLSSSTLNSGDEILSTKPTIFPSTASSSSSSSLSLKAAPPTFSSLPPSLISPIDADHSQLVTDTFAVITEAGTDDLNAGTSRAIAPTLPKEKEASLAPSQSVRITLSAGPTDRTSQVPPLTPRLDIATTTTASVKLTTATVASSTETTNPTTATPSLRVITGTTQSATTTTLQPTPVTRRTTTTTIRTQTSRRTFTPLVLRTSPPRVGAATTVFISPFTTTTTEAPPQQCNITERMWVKTVVSIYVRRNRLDSIQRQNLRRGLSQGLRKALNDTAAQAQVETVFGSPNMTVAYHVTGGDMVYPPSVVLEGLDSYGRDKLIADLRQYLPMVTALPLPAALWRPSPATGFQLKTVLQFVGAGDNPRSCRFSQMMEKRLEKVFSEAQAKVLSTNSRLSVQMLSVTQAAGSPAVSLVYTVSNGTVFLNGTTASNLLGQLSAELVGYFLFYPPLIIAEPLEYHNLNTSIATRDFWVITVIQDVDNASLEGQYQSFASLMEQRLAELFVLAGQQGTRFRRATTVGSYIVQMVSIRRVSGLKNPAEMTYYVQHNGVPLPGTSAAKVLNTVDSQTMALTLGYFVQLQAEPVVKNPPNNLWIIAAVLAPIAVVTLIIIIITAVLCRKNKNDFKADAIGNLNPRAKMAYRRDVGYYHQPVQGFDYAKQHLGQQGGDEETLPVSQDTLVMSLQIRDTPLSLEKALQQDGTANKKSLTADKRKSKLPSEDGSVISNESEKPNSGRGLTVPKVTAQQKLTKEETRKRDDPYDTSSGSLQLISIKPMAAQPSYSHPASSDRSQDSAVVNGEVNLALKQKSDIEHYRNKLRLKAKRKGYYDFPSNDGGSSGRALAHRQQHGHERAAGEHGRPLEPDDERGSTYVKSHRRHSQVGQAAYRSRQSLSSPSPGGTEMDLLVMRERPRRGIRNSGYDTEPELIEETNVDRLVGPRGYMYGRGLKGHSETSTLSSQPSIDEVRQQMHLLLEEAFSLASGGQSTSGRHSHHHHQHHQPPPDHYTPAPPPLPYADVVTSAPGTMSCGQGGLQWVPSYGADVYQCSLPKPAFRFTQLPEMAMGSPPPLPPRTGPPPGTSLRRSTSDLGPKGRSSETSVTEIQSRHDNNPYGLPTRAALPPITAEQPVSNYSGNPITAVYAIPASRPGYPEYFVSTPPTSYHSPSWMSYPPEPEDVPPQWADSVPLPGYVEAFPHPRYPEGSPIRLPLEYNQALEQPTVAPSTASQQSLPQVVKDMDSMPLSSLSTSALVQAIRQEVAKLAKKQNDMFEF